MGHWNHRVVRHRCRAFARSLEGVNMVEVAEVYYNDDGKVRGHTQGKPLLEETVADLHETLERMRTALGAPVLDCMCDKQEDADDEFQKEENQA